MKKFRLIMVIMAGILCVTVLTYADVPRILNYQGKFTDNNNNPLSGNYLVTFRFYETESAGNVIWEEGHILALNSGVFNALLGSIKPLEIDFNKDLWLGVEVASDGEMSPRIKLASSAYAFNAQTIDMIESSQLVRNDVDSVMEGSLTLKKNLVLTDANGQEYCLWMDDSGNLRLKQGLPTSDKDGAMIIKEGSRGISTNFIKNTTPLLLFAAVLILALIFYSTKKK